jgi:hypothetical protein
MFSHLPEMPSVQSFGNVKNPDTFAYGSSARIVADNLSERLAERLIFSRIELRKGYLLRESSVSGRIQLFARRTQPFAPMVRPPAANLRAVEIDAKKRKLGRRRRAIKEETNPNV